MSDPIRQKMMQHLSDPTRLQSFLFDVRRGLSPCPSDQDILGALEACGSGTEFDTIRARAHELAQRRIHRRRVVAERQHCRLMAKLRDFW